MKRIVLSLINFYQRTFIGGNCRFIPTCSEYTYQAVVRYGTIKGLILGLKRLLRCHPFSRGGIDQLT